MKYLAPLPDGTTIKLRYSDKVYSPKYSSVDTVVIADKLIKWGIKSVLDVGCGSGVIGLSLKRLHPELNMTLCDIDPNAVKMARNNSKQLKLDVSVRKRGVELSRDGWDMIVANLPTFDSEQMKNEVLYGPDMAYEGYLSLYEDLFTMARTRILVCECQRKHQKEFLKLADDWGWRLILRTDFGFAFAPMQIFQPGKSVPDIKIPNKTN